MRPAPGRNDAEDDEETDGSATIFDARECRARPAASFRCLCREFLVNDVNRHLILLFWGDLENLGVFLKDRHVTGFEVVDVSRFQHSVAILTLDAYAALYQITPMWRLTHVVRQSLEQGCRINAFGERFIRDDHPAPFDQAAAETISIVVHYRQLLHRIMHLDLLVDLSKCR